MAIILSTCRVTENSKFEIWGTALQAVFLPVLPPLVPLTGSLKYRPVLWTTHQSTAVFHLSAATTIRRLALIGD